MAAALMMGATSARAEIVVGLTTANELATFDHATPGSILSSLQISGLQQGELLQGIDRRPADGLLYGVSDGNRVYRIDTGTGVATLVNTLTVPLNGTAFGVDFNPVPDRLRIVSDTDQNLRHNPNVAGTTINDGGLAYAAGDANFGANPSVVGVAYTNNFAGAATTTLFGIDNTLGVLVTQNPPNAGTLNTVGPLGVSTGSLVGFDISGLTGTAYASLFVSGASRLYTINLGTGSATLLGLINTGNGIRDIALATGTPEPGSMILLGMGVAGLVGHGLIRRRRRSAA